MRNVTFFSYDLFLIKYHSENKILIIFFFSHAFVCIEKAIIINYM